MHPRGYVTTVNSLTVVRALTKTTTTTRSKDDEASSSILAGMAAVV
jgi:hypothetical protein